jgi:heme oxygenase
LTETALGAFSTVAMNPSLRHELRVATADVHARLHLHAGLAAVAAERIDVSGYRQLLLRLYGFYLPFENAAGLEPVRSGWLATDLTALATPESRLATAALCATLPRLDSPQAVLGAMYVVEGSALGGRGLARQLNCILGDATLSGRRFFASDGVDTGRAWRAFVDRIDRVANRDRKIVIDAAIETFCCFETWMDGWEAAGNA